MKLSNNGNILVASSDDKSIKFFDISELPVNPPKLI